MARDHSTSTSSRNGNGRLTKAQRKELTEGFELQEVQSLFANETIDSFRNNWMIDCHDRKRVMERMRDLAETKPHPYVSGLIATRISFYNSGFEIQGASKVADTQAWLDKHANYPFRRLARDVWKEFETCSNVVAFWRQPRTGDNSSIDGLPRITIFDCEKVRYENEFGVERLWIRPARRKLKSGERRRLGKRYADAIEEGKELLVDESEGEYFKVLSTAKLGDGLGMPVWKAIFDDLAILDLLKIGDWNGSWARKKISRHTKKGHDIKDGPLAGQPDFYFKKEFGVALKKLLNATQGYSELVTNFDQIMEYIFLESGFFDPKVYEAVELRLDRFAGALGMMMREGANPSPYLMPVFRAEGLDARDIVGGFIADILNDKNFHGSNKPPARLVPTWDETIFFNEKMLTTWLSLVYQNGFASPQTMRRWLRLNDGRENELMKAARGHEEDYQPVFEPKQGLLVDDPAGAGGGGDGRPKKGDGGTA